MAARFPRHWILVLVLIAAVIGGALYFRRRAPQYPSAYVSDRAATLWSTTAVVRQPVATLAYGSRVAVLRRIGDQAQVRTDDGANGWLDARVLMDPALWQQSAELLARARTLPVQAIGHTKAFSNVHLEPGRQTTRIFQFGRDVPLEVFERKMVPAASAAPAAGTVPVANVSTGSSAGTGAGKDASREDAESSDQSKDQPSENQQPKEEEWLLVMRSANGAAPPSASADGSSYATSQGGGSATAAASTDTAAAIPMAGWVLAQFVALDPPQPIPDYAGASGLNVVAWVALDPAADPEGAKPQYLVAGDHDGASRGCDFNALRAYTWDAARQRYETAYIENDLCGELPIIVRKSSDGTEFSFPDADESDRQRVYRMKQTTVRLVTESKSSKGR